MNRTVFIKALCDSYLHIIGNGASLTNIYYFSALAKHLESTDSEITRRHRTYLDCLRSTGVRVELFRFKEKKFWCNHCRNIIIRHEEKETDVAIAVRLFESFYTDESDTVVIMSGDTDIAPAVQKEILILYRATAAAILSASENKERRGPAT